MFKESATQIRKSLISPDSNSNTLEPYPDPSRCLGIPNSYRFGPKIAELASPFAVHPVGSAGLVGMGPKGPGVTAQDCKHALFIFPDDSTDGVLDAFGKHALEVLGEVNVTRGTINAVGHVHQDDPKVSPGHAHYPKSVGHYWEGYAVEISRKDPYPRTIAQYVRVAQGLVAQGYTLSPGVEKIASGTLELARRIGDIGDLKGKARTHRAVVVELEGAAASLTTYRNFLRRFLVEKAALSEDGWPSHAEELTTVAAALCRGWGQIRVGLNNSWLGPTTTLLSAQLILHRVMPLRTSSVSTAAVEPSTSGWGRSIP